ncbi:unnamed protein product [Chironomus riparius]|uniref:Uncharacterized protein n=1 Tax=Chironomus riparius TaxID=315576 RepID=A0A9N9RIS6_9DIPT|nr:unnamed protein product [Chironomus riparius]
MWKNFTFILFLSIISIALQSDYKVLTLEKCYGDNKSVIIETCNFVNGYLFNNKMKIIQPINFMMFKLSIFKKDSNNEFRELFKNIPTLNWCKIMDGTSKLTSNFLVKIIILVVKEKFPEIYKRCPLGPGIVDKVNTTIDRRVVVMFPTGIYRINVAWINKGGDLMFNFLALLEIFN